MEAILNDLKSAYEKLNVEVLRAEKKNVELSELVNKANIKLADISARSVVMAEKEAKYKEFDNVEVLKRSVSEARLAVNIEKNALNVEKAAIAKQSSDLKETQKKLDEMIAIYKNKQEKCDAYQVKLEKDRAEMKQSIIADLQKGLK